MDHLNIIVRIVQWDINLLLVLSMKIQQYITNQYVNLYAALINILTMLMNVKIVMLIVHPVWSNQTIVPHVLLDIQLTQLIILAKNQKILFAHFRCFTMLLRWNASYVIKLALHAQGLLNMSVVAANPHYTLICLICGICVYKVVLWALM